MNVPVARETIAGDDNVSPIPDDGHEHDCVCGVGPFRSWDGDGWLGNRRAVTNDDGESVSECRGCGRELIVVTATPG